MPNWTQLIYLLRYLALIVWFAAAVMALWRSLFELKRRMRAQQESAHGFFLLSQVGEADHVRSLPLYALTQIGYARSNDICLSHDTAIRRHHASIYLYNGHWYIKPSSRRAPVYLNDCLLSEGSRLHSEDILRIGKQTFAFVDERQAATEAGLAYEFPKLKREPRIPTRFIQVLSLAFNFYLVAALFLNLEPAPSFMQSRISLFVAFFLGLASLYSLILPRLFHDFDLMLYSAFTNICTFGYLLQLRYLLLNRPWEAIQQLDPNWQETLLRESLKLSLISLVGLLMVPLLVWLASRTKFLERVARLCFVLTPLLYVLSLVLGRDIADSGARLWLQLPGGFVIQPSEFAKLSYLIALAYFFMNRPLFRRQLLFAFWAALNFLLILKLPDLGSIMILLPLTLLLYVVMTSAYSLTAMIVVSSAGLFAYAYHFMPYVQRRIQGWLTLWTEVNDQNRQIIYGLQAISRGQVFGVGFGQSDPRAIPLASSDMVFASICEELGILAGLALIMYFTVICLRAAAAFCQTRDGFSAALILAMSTFFFAEMAVVIGGSCGLIPLTGATLPFVAKGGSSMLAKWLIMGLLLGLVDRRDEGWQT